MIIGGGGRKALLPQYLCRSVIEPFVNFGYELFYFPVGKRFEISQNILEEYVERYAPQLILVQSYFGFDTLKGLRKYLNKLRSRDIIVIEDITHCIPAKGWEECSDFKIGSLRKWCGLPDGGVLQCNKKIPKPRRMDENITYVSQRITAQIKKREYFSKQEVSFDKMDFIKLYNSSEEILDAQTKYYSMSEYSRERFWNIPWDYITRKRADNYRLLQEKLKEIINIKLINFDYEGNEIPLYCPIFIKNRYRDRLREELRKMDILCPVIWPIPDNINWMLDDYVKEIYSQILAVPCDQRYGYKDIVFVVDKIKQLMGNTKLSRL